MSGVLDAAQALAWSGGRLRQGDPATTFAGVSIDSRSLRPGELFLAIRGERFDAHDFLADARARGAAGVVVERNRVPDAALADLVVIEVDDTTRALGAIAAGHRAGFAGPLVAITGSNGKTTTKEMCAKILGVRGSCLRNEGNLNNLYGLPLTLLRRTPRHRAVVVELGTNQPGEIAALAAIARPTVGVLTNVGSAHVEKLGSREGIAREKGALLEALEPRGVAVVNADDERVMAQTARTRARLVRFGRGADADVRCEAVTALGERGFAFELVAPEGRVAVHVPGLGEVTVCNALAAAAAALACDATLEQVATGLARHRPVSGRMERVRLPRNVILINDSYNANPQSMRAALESLAALKGPSRGLAVLGEMAELGAAAPAAHRDAGRLVGELGIELLFALGEHAGEVAAGALEAGMDPDRVHVGKDHAELAARIGELLRGNDWVLVKGSRSMHMERVVQALAAEEA